MIEAIERDEPEWVTADGVHILIRDMSDRHLVSTVHMLVRKAIEYMHFYAMELSRAQLLVTGELANHYLDRDLEELHNSTIYEFLDSEVSVFSDLVEELKIRKLMCPKLEERLYS